MGPGSEAHDGEARKRLDLPNIPSRHVSNTPTSLRLLRNRDLPRDDADEHTSKDPSEDSNKILEAYDSEFNRSHGKQLLNLEKLEHAIPDTAIVSSMPKSLEKKSTNASLRTADSSPSRLPSLSQVPSMANSIASLSVDSQAPLSSLPSSPRSLSRQSMHHSSDGSVGEIAGQAITSDSEEEESRHDSEMQDSFPQLIMPSIRMPSRRPFTKRGKELGRLKILLAGASGTGKSSLIKSIVQKCEDIVHIDPLISNTSQHVKIPETQTRKPKPSRTRGTQSIAEVYASTKPYPSWRSDAEYTNFLGRRKSIGNTVLERNLCFIDTPGHGGRLSCAESMEGVLNYIGQQARSSFSLTASEGDLTGLLSGMGGVQVDLALYLVSNSFSKEDLDFVKCISTFTNVIILLSKSDEVSLEETKVLRSSLMETLQKESVEQFQFPGEKTRQPPFAICSVPSDDDENMDASVLMSSAYVQPLVPSELDLLLDQIFDKENVSCMRHLAAKKLVEARRGKGAWESPTAFARNVLNAGLHSSPLPSPAFPASANTRGLSPFIRATISDHTFYEERLAQIKLAKWAADLQRSLQNERLRYESLLREEQRAWLQRKVHELEQDSRADNVHSSGAWSSPTSAKLGARGLYRPRRDEDPLGLAQLHEMFTQHGLAALRVAGGFGVLGAVVVWVARNWSYGQWDWWKGA